MNRFSPVHKTVLLALGLLSVWGLSAIGWKSDNFPTSDMSLGAQNGSVSLAVAGAEGRVPEDENGQRNPSTGRAGNHGSYDGNGGGHLRSVSVASIVAAPGKLGAILRDVRQAARIEVLEVGRG